MKQNNPNKLLLCGIVFAAFAMRAPMSAIGPLVKTLQATYALSSKEAGLITTIPLIIFAIVSPLAGTFGARFRSSSIFLTSLAAIVIGSFFRSYQGLWGLFFGTLILGIGIGTLNVIQPAFIHENFPAKVGLVTGIYNVSMNSVSALGSGVSLPLAVRIGRWQHSLFLWSGFALLGMLIWGIIRAKEPQTSTSKATPQTQDVRGKEPIQRTKFWLIAGFMGLQAFTFFCMMAWYPTIMGTKTSSPNLPGYLMLYLQVISLITGFFIPILTQKLPSRTPIAVAAGLSYFLGLGTVLASTSLPVLVIGSTITGLASGASFSYALTLIGLNGRTKAETARLSGLSQMVGYILASIGPFILGFVYDTTHGWTIPVIILMVVSLCMMVVGILAGRLTEVDQPQSLSIQN